MTERTQIEMDGTTYEVINNWNLQHGHRVIYDGHRIKILKPLPKIGVVKTSADKHNALSD